MEILLSDEDGKLLAQVSGDASLIIPLLPGAHDASYQCLAFVDPYGDTEFNRLQIPILANEIRQIRGKAKNDETRKVLDEVLGLCDRGGGLPHARLKFVGD